MLMAYSTIACSDFLFDPFWKYDFGWMIISVFALNFSLNVLFIIYSSFLVLIKTIREKLANSKKKK